MGPEESPIAVGCVLDIVKQFEAFGGVSLGLVAWELMVPESAISDAWAQADAAGLFEPAGVDSTSGEPLVLLTALGREHANRPLDPYGAA
jgi:hypothetical protein